MKIRVVDFGETDKFCNPENIRSDPIRKKKLKIKIRIRSDPENNEKSKIRIRTDPDFFLNSEIRIRSDP